MELGFGARGQIFEHLEKKWVGYLLATMIAFMVLMVGGVGPDVHFHSGQNWDNVAAQQVVEQGMKTQPAQHGDTPAEHH